MLLVCICSYVNSVLRYMFLIFYAYCSDTLYLHEQGNEDPWLFFKARRGPRAKSSENTVLEEKKVHIICVILQLTKN